MTHEKNLTKLQYEDLNFIGGNPLYELAKKHDMTIIKEFVSNWLKINEHNSKLVNYSKERIQTNIFFG